MSLIRITIPFQENAENINAYGPLRTFRMAAECGSGIDSVKRLMNGFIDRQDVYFEMDSTYLSLLESEWGHIQVIYQVEYID
ncbi:hypothetical protein [Xanthocytophaga flava]|uniref:hypothetical protein n=1 Tax=Xanthocytophaga flava TaxID=3048013 RepID=UPI0028D7C792|nr:hypothetical protein [Xanthocytophaga flavus]